MVAETNAVNAETVKVGDRVKTKGPYSFDPTTGEVVRLDNGLVKVKIENGDVWPYEWSELELLPVAEATGKAEGQPNPLTIEAGKHYRTRDGRKVGPMEKWHLGGWHADRAPVPLNGGLWNDDGTAWFENSKDSPDLIAEWLEVQQTEPTIIKTPSIVALIDNGQPMPAVRPLLHDSKEDAEKEAHRLSEKHRGKEFGVFTLTAKHKAEAIYDHEWQRLAANGNKIGAIKAIRELTGFGLKASKDGLEDWLSRNAA